jgi:hypothetical protein
MSVLLVETLQDELSQNISFTGEDRIEIAAFLPYFYVHNVSGATFTFEIQGDSGTIFAQDFTSEEISQAVNGQYAHVFYPIIPANPVQLQPGSYTFKIKSKSGYVASDRFLGWIKQYNDIQNAMSYSPTSDRQNSFAIRFKIYREGIKQ